MINRELYKSFYISLFSEHLGGKIQDTQNYCGGNGSMLAFGPSGKAFPCLRYMSYTLQKEEEKTVGNAGVLRAGIG